MDQDTRRSSSRGRERTCLPCGCCCKTPAQWWSKVFGGGPGMLLFEIRQQVSHHLRNCPPPSDICQSENLQGTIFLRWPEYSHHLWSALRYISIENCWFNRAPRNYSLALIFSEPKPMLIIYIGGRGENCLTNSMQRQQPLNPQKHLLCYSILPLPLQEAGLVRPESLLLWVCVPLCS